MKPATSVGTWVLSLVLFSCLVCVPNTPETTVPEDGVGLDPSEPDAGQPSLDAGDRDAGADGGFPDAGVDAGVPDGGTDAGVTFAVEVVHSEARFDLLAVDPDGTAYGVNLNDSGTELWSSGDGRTWAKRGATKNGAYFVKLAALSDGILLADMVNSAGHAIARSTDHGVTWDEVLSIGVYRSLTPHSFAELDGATYFLEYQVFTGVSTPIRLWKSMDRGSSWTLRYTFIGHRHGHGMLADPASHALWAFFGDTNPQSGVYRSTDGGATWAAIVAGSQDGDIVDATLLPDGSLLCGQDITFLPTRPTIAHIALDGSVTHLQTLPSASYSTHAVSAGGYVVGTTFEYGNDVSPPGWTSGSLWGSADGLRWEKVLEVPQQDPTGDVGTVVYWELASGELVVNVWNAEGFGPNGRGYMLLRTHR